MGIKLGDQFPNFTANTTQGEIKFHDFVTADGWAILFSHPADYTPVCTTELGKATEMEPEFKKRGVKLIALSCDTVEDHKGWIKDIDDYNKCKCTFPIIDDKQRVLAKQLEMLDPDEKDSTGIPLTCRAVFIIGPGYKLKLSMLYPATTGRNFDELIRVVDSLQLTANKKVATPANWKSGGKCMVIPSVKGDEAKKLFPNMETVNVPSGKQYIRMTPDPSDK